MFQISDWMCGFFCLCHVSMLWWQWQQQLDFVKLDSWRRWQCFKLHVFSVRQENKNINITAHLLLLPGENSPVLNSFIWNSSLQLTCWARCSVGSRRAEIHVSCNLPNYSNDGWGLRLISCCNGLKWTHLGEHAACRWPTWAAAAPGVCSAVCAVKPGSERESLCIPAVVAMVTIGHRLKRATVDVRTPEKDERCSSLLQALKLAITQPNLLVQLHCG